MISSIVEGIVGRVTRRKQEWRAAIEKDVRDVAITAAKSELGLTPQEQFTDQRIDHQVGILEASGWSQQKLRANVDRIKKRYEWAKVHSDSDQRKAAAAQAEQDKKAFEVVEGERLRAAHEKRRALEEKARLSQIKHEEALAAEAMLMDTADASPEERKLTSRLQELGKQKAKLEAMISPNRHPSEPGYLIPMPHEYPGCLLAQIKVELAEFDDNTKAIDSSPARKKLLRERLAFTERVVNEKQRELSTVEKEIAAVNASLAKLAQAWMLPENFKVIDPRPSRTELMKRHAAELGYAPEPV